MAEMRSSGRVGDAVAAQLSEVLLLLGRARRLFGDNPIRPPDRIGPDIGAAARRVV
ncbi:hypothetical protein KIH27_09070 [Mycobacterium sp. M1]|uniref:Uncharacterized protein n=1 Tax=Mycolicibacter acidiphilus TaxID=2835306 RepID=A0ABS5RJS8_9MYCO|nr:hypothetical protein [Mycolicibacter acidiphilus]MBS9533736.1 hypothetical protein [Mycolicibacter acidiphilus]